MDVPNSRAIAKQLLTLAKDPDNQPFIVQEQGCLAGLVQYTQHDDIEVVLIATRAIQFLSSHPDNKNKMSEFPSLVKNLFSTLPRAKEHIKVKEFVYETLDNLSVAYNKEDFKDLQEEDIQNENNENVALNANIDPTLHHNKIQLKDKENVQKSARKQKSTRLQGDFRTLTFFVPGVHDRSLRQRLETLVIQVEGVISITINIDKEHLLIGTRDKSDDIINDIIADLSSEGCSVKLVVSKKNGKSKGEENYDEDYDDLNGGDSLDYLEESDFDTDDEEEHTIARHGYSSLEARLEQQRKEEEERKAEKATRIVGKVSGILSNASSWLMGY